MPFLTRYRRQWKQAAVSGSIGQCGAPKRKARISEPPTALIFARNGSKILAIQKGGTPHIELIVESWLLILYAKLAVNSCDDALNLTECEHTTKESIA